MRKFIYFIIILFLFSGCIDKNLYMVGDTNTLQDYNGATFNDYNQVYGQTYFAGASITIEPDTNKINVNDANLHITGGGIDTNTFTAGIQNSDNNQFLIDINTTGQIYADFNSRIGNDDNYFEIGSVTVNLGDDLLIVPKITGMSSFYGGFKAGAFDGSLIITNEGGSSSVLTLGDISDLSKEVSLEYLYETDQLWITSDVNLYSIDDEEYYELKSEKLTSLSGDICNSSDCYHISDIGAGGSGTDTNTFTAGIQNPDNNQFLIDLNTTGKISTDKNVHFGDDQNYFLISKMPITASDGTKVTVPIIIPFANYAGAGSINTGAWYGSIFIGGESSRGAGSAILDLTDISDTNNGVSIEYDFLKRQLWIDEDINMYDIDIPELYHQILAGKLTSMNGLLCDSDTCYDIDDLNITGSGSFTDLNGYVNQAKFDGNFFSKFNAYYDGNFWLRFKPAFDGNINDLNTKIRADMNFFVGKANADMNFGDTKIRNDYNSIIAIKGLDLNYALGTFAMTASNSQFNLSKNGDINAENIAGSSLTGRNLTTGRVAITTTGGALTTSANLLFASPWLTSKFTAYSTTAWSEAMMRVQKNTRMYTGAVVLKPQNITWNDDTNAIGAIGMYLNDQNEATMTFNSFKKSGTRAWFRDFNEVAMSISANGDVNITQDLNVKRTLTINGGSTFANSGEKDLNAIGGAYVNLDYPMPDANYPVLITPILSHSSMSSLIGCGAVDRNANGFRIQCNAVGTVWVNGRVSWLAINNLR